MKKLGKFFLWLIAFIAVVLAVGFLLPKTSRVERTVEMDSKPEVVYAWVNDLKTYDQWMPWNRIDTGMAKEYGDKTSGTGSWYKWDSQNKEVGKGKLSITESVPSEKVVTKLEFADYDPSYGGWIITPTAAGSSVKWYMEMDCGNNPAMRWMGLIMGKMMGGQFQAGLDSLKSSIKKNPLPGA